MNNFFRIKSLKTGKMSYLCARKTAELQFAACKKEASESRNLGIS